MSTTQARISIPLKLGALEIVGSEEFVATQLESLRDFIFNGPPGVADVPDEEDGTPVFQAQRPRVEGNPYPNVFVLDTETIRIISAIPGASNAERTINAVLLALLGASLAGRGGMSFADLRQICAEHGFLDPTNFSKYVKSRREHILVTGNGKSQTARLTHPGTAVAEGLAETLNRGDAT